MINQFNFIGSPRLSRWKKPEIPVYLVYLLSREEQRTNKLKLITGYKILVRLVLTTNAMVTVPMADF